MVARRPERFTSTFSRGLSGAALPPERTGGAFAHRGRHIEGLLDQPGHGGAGQWFELHIDLLDIRYEFGINTMASKPARSACTRPGAIPGGPIRDRPIALPLA